MLTDRNGDMRDDVAELNLLDDPLQMIASAESHRTSPIRDLRSTSAAAQARASEASEESEPAVSAMMMSFDVKGRPGLPGSP
jgi:hypothetical protein